MAKKRKPNFLIVLIDDLRFDELGICGHPYMKTPHIDRIGHEGAMFTAAFHTTPLCSPNRASILTGQYASRHGIIDNVARDAHSHRLPNYHVDPAAAGLRDRPCRQVAHGQFRRAAAGLRPLGELPGPRLDHRSGPEHRRQGEASTKATSPIS